MVNAMRGSKAKEIRDIISYKDGEGNPTIRRLYRRIKKTYVRLPEKVKPVFLNYLKEKYERKI